MSIQNHNDGILYQHSSGQLDCMVGQLPVKETMEGMFQQVITHYGFWLAGIGDYGKQENLKIKLGIPFTVSVEPEIVECYDDRGLPNGWRRLVGWWITFSPFNSFVKLRHYFNGNEIEEMKKRWELKKLNGDKL